MRHVGCKERNVRRMGLNLWGSPLWLPSDAISSGDCDGAIA